VLSRLWIHLAYSSGSNFKKFIHHIECIDSSLKPRNRRVQRITLHDPNNDYLHRIPQLFPSLTSFSIQYQYKIPTPTSVRPIPFIDMHANLKLFSLRIQRYFGPTSGISLLCCRNLRDLTLDHCRYLSNSDLKQIAFNVKNLRSLQLIGCGYNITEEGLLYFISQNKTLIHVSLGWSINSSPLTPLLSSKGLVSFINECKYLESIELLQGTESAIDNISITKIKTLQNLKTLFIQGGDKVSVGQFATILLMNHLKRLIIRNAVNVSTQFFTNLQKYRNRIEEIELNGLSYAIPKDFCFAIRKDPYCSIQMKRIINDDGIKFQFFFHNSRKAKIFLKNK